jgi:transitional endoplasmic reticulum ATPase
MEKLKKLAEEGLRLKVTEALGKDVGRALVRMDPADIKALGVEIGDIVEIVGKRRTVCKVMPAFKWMASRAAMRKWPWMTW